MKIIIKFLEKFVSKGEDLGWSIAGENIRANNLRIFKTPRNLIIINYKVYYNSN